MLFISLSWFKSKWLLRPIKSLLHSLVFYSGKVHFWVMRRVIFEEFLKSSYGIRVFFMDLLSVTFILAIFSSDFIQRSMSKVTIPEVFSSVFLPCKFLHRKLLYIQPWDSLTRSVHCSTISRSAAICRLLLLSTKYIFLHPVQSKYHKQPLR